MKKRMKWCGAAVRSAVGCLVLGGLSTGGVVTAQDGGGDLPYVSGSTGADGALRVPQSLPNRWGFGSAYDAARDRIVVFGGTDTGESGVRTAGLKAETWLFDGTEWSLAEHDTFVAARHRAEMVYDPVRQEVVLFGGQRSDNLVMNETWVWDGTDWTRREPATVPPGRYDHEMVWDSVGNRVVMFGGLSPGDLRDTWVWDGADWTDLQVAPPRPDYTNQAFDDMVFDEADGRVLLYSATFAQTYAFANGTWALVPTSPTPQTGQSPAMAYDPVRQRTVLYAGSSVNQTWEFDGQDWVQRSPAFQPRHRWYHGLVWHAGRGTIVTFGGTNNNFWLQNTAEWDGENWTQLLDRWFVVDMNTRPTGVWHYTSIFVPSSKEVLFRRNTANTPVIWLATEGVVINGIVNVSGQGAPPNDLSGAVALGGPGGFDGGQGGVRFNISGKHAGTPGQGPGGGDAPTAPGLNGTSGRYNGVYGNALIQPLIGGSGGSGGSATDTQEGGNGGGGGGAILIASSRDVVINGSILAQGGIPSAVVTWGGAGSGGAIRVVADRILGSGTANANGASHGTTGGPGRIRLEAFYRPFAPRATPVPSASAPVESIDLGDQPELHIVSVAGANVEQPPSGSLSDPDVVFTAAGTVAIRVQGVNVPTGTEVRLRLTTSESVIRAPGEGEPAVTLDGSGFATFNVQVPRGPGTIQAFAEFLANP